jgi:hypothetical protein
MRSMRACCPGNPTPVQPRPGAQSARRDGWPFPCFADQFTKGATFAAVSPAAPAGGGLYNNGTATLQECSLFGNSAGSGGGIFISGTLTVAGSVVCNNHAPLGADLDHLGVVTLNDSTVGVSVSVP